MADKINFDDIIKKAAQSGKNGELESESGVNDFIEKNLSKKDAEKLKSVLSDEKKLKTILDSDAAKALFKKLTGGSFNV